MQLPLPLHTEAQRDASAVPAPPVIRSIMPAAVAPGSAAPSPAGVTIGQARKQSPQRVQASAIASPRALKSSIYPAAAARSFISYSDFVGPDPPAQDTELIVSQRDDQQCVDLLAVEHD